jgi:hypothetical protein
MGLDPVCRKIAGERPGLRFSFVGIPRKTGKMRLMLVIPRSDTLSKPVPTGETIIHAAAVVRWLDQVHDVALEPPAANAG